MSALRNSARAWLALGAALFFLTASALRPCTIAVVSGKISKDGRPLLWKNRDVTAQDSLACFFHGAKHAFIGIIDTGQTDKVFAGINAAGLAIVNAVSTDLEGSSESENGIFIKRILDECATVNEVEDLLSATNAKGRKTLANFGIIDAGGNGAIFETGNSSFTKYDVDNAPGGFLVRTNFAFTGTKPEEGEGFIRFNRATDLLARASAGPTIDPRFLMEKVARDLVNESVDPYPLPFQGSQNNHPPGYIYTNYSINRYRTACCTVFHGVRGGEDPSLATMWCILGEPVCGVAFPLWVKAGAMPYVLGGNFTSPLRDAVKLKERQCYSDPLSDKYIDTKRLRNAQGQGLLPFLEKLEALIFLAADVVQTEWRAAPPDSARVMDFESGLSTWVYKRYLSENLR